MEEKKCEYKILIGQLEIMRPLGRPSTWKDIIVTFRPIAK
jgi:hypothetical protein